MRPWSANASCHSAAVFDRSRRSARIGVSSVPEFLRQRSQPRARDIVDDHPGSSAGKGPRGGRADATSRARDEHDPTREIDHVTLSDHLTLMGRSVRLSRVRSGR